MGESRVPSNTMSPGPRPTLVPSGHPSSSLATMSRGRHGPKRVGAAVPLSVEGDGELGPYLTQRGLGRGLPLYQVASWSIQPFDHNRHGLKIGKAAMPPFLRWGELGPHLIQCGLGRGLYLHTKWHSNPSNRLATIRQRHKQDRQTDRQWSDTKGRTVLQMVAQKPNDCYKLKQTC